MRAGGRVQLGERRTMGRGGGGEGSSEGERVGASVGKADHGGGFAIRGGLAT
jgi:hypothetical protein